MFRFIEQNSTPVYEIFPMRNIMLLTWLQRGAASRKPGIKIIAPALMTCDEVDISWIFQPCDSSSGADELFGGSSGIVRYFNILSFNLLVDGVCDNE